MRGTGRGLYCDVIEGERGGERTVLRDERWIAFVPPFARWPYEVHLAPIAHRGSLEDLDPDDDESLARSLQGLLQKYDRLFNQPLPYVMAMHQRPPGRGGKHHHFHIEFYPPNRTKEKLKYLAGSELRGAGHAGHQLVSRGACRRCCWAAPRHGRKGGCSRVPACGAQSARRPRRRDGPVRLCARQARTRHAPRLHHPRISSRAIS